MNYPKLPMMPNGLNAYPVFSATLISLAPTPKILLSWLNKTKVQAEATFIQSDFRC